MSTRPLLSTHRIESCIYRIRGQKVMLDRDLASLDGIKPIALRQQVKRNAARFPSDFMFQITDDEANILVSQNVIPSKQSLGGSLPCAFTQEGVAMLSSVLRSKRAVQVNIEIMRAFVAMRKMLFSYAELAYRIDKLEESYDEQFKIVFDRLRELMKPEPPLANERPLGFRLE